MKLNKLQLEKVNMKVVVSIGVGIIVVLTAMFIIFRTNLIFDNDDKEKEPTTNENGGNGSSNNGENGGNEENPNVDPNNPDNGENGNGSNEGENGNGNGNGNGNNGNSGNKEPNYDDVEEDDISDEAKDRTKDKDELTVAEKEYIFQENIVDMVGTGKDAKKNCGGEVFCVADVTECNEYTSKTDKITDCTGEIIFTYNEEKKGFDFDMANVSCE